MKKKLTALTAMMLATGFVLGSCGSSGGKKSGGSGELIRFDGFAEELYPDMENIETREGKIDVCLVFEGTEKGWSALADAYMGIHDNEVVVKINSQYTAADYPTKLNGEVTSNKTDWDIVQGNLFDGGNLQDYCINMSASIEEVNPYAGVDIYWDEVLERNAYITDQTGQNTATRIINSEGLQTAWFVNDVAFDAAVAKGYLNEEGKAERPITWDDLMNLCAKMQEAGYANPLGISVALTRLALRNLRGFFVFTGTTIIEMNTTISWKATTTE